MIAHRMTQVVAGTTTPGISVKRGHDFTATRLGRGSGGQLAALLFLSRVSAIGGDSALQSVPPDRSRDRAELITASFSNRCFNPITI